MHCFCHFVLVWGLFQVLCSGIIPGKGQGTIWDRITRIKPRCSVFRANTLSTILLPFFFFFPPSRIFFICQFLFLLFWGGATQPCSESTLGFVLMEQSWQAWGTIWAPEIEPKMAMYLLCYGSSPFSGGPGCYSWQDLDSLGKWVNARVVTLVACGARNS